MRACMSACVFMGKVDMCAHVESSASCPGLSCDLCPLLGGGVTSVVSIFHLLLEATSPVWHRARVPLPKGKKEDFFGGSCNYYNPLS